MEFSVVDTINSMSETITGLQKSFVEIKGKVDAYKVKSCTTEEINRLTDIEKRLGKVEKANTRNGSQLQSTIQTVKVLTQKIEHLSSTIVIPRQKSDTKLKSNTQSQRIEEKQRYDTARLVTGGSDDLKMVESLSITNANVSESNESRISCMNEDGDQLHMLENKTDGVELQLKQVNRDANLILNIQPNKKETTKIKQRPKKVRSESGDKLCLTAENEDNRFSFHQKKECFPGELLLPVVKRDNTPITTGPNITKKRGRLTTSRNNEARKDHKGFMTMSEVYSERGSNIGRNVHSMNEWMKIASDLQFEVAGQMITMLDKISRNGLDYMILMDTSESMRGEKLKLMKKAAIEYINGIQTVNLQCNVRDNIGLACFGDETKLITPPHAEYDEIKAEIGKLKHGGPSPLAAGLLMAIAGLTHYKATTFGNHDFPPCIIVMTDGVPTRVGATKEDDSDRPALLMSMGENNFLPVSETFARDREIKAAVHMILRGGIKVYWIPFGSDNEEVMAKMVTETSGEIVHHHQILRLSRMTINFFHAAEIATALGTKADYDKTMVKRAVENAGFKKYDEYDDITDNVMVLLDPVSQYHGRFKQPRWEAIPLGTRVRRGPNWKWENQDKKMAGTVIGEESDGKIYVEWDYGHRNRYDYDENLQKFDIRVVNEPRVLVDDLIAVGCKVKREKKLLQIETSANVCLISADYIEKVEDRISQRKRVIGITFLFDANVIPAVTYTSEIGKDWRFGDQDGGTGGRGTVLRVQQNGKIVVKWDRGRLCTYKFGGDGLFEVEVCDQRQIMNSSDLILPPTQDTTMSSTFPSPEEEIETQPLILPLHKSKHIKSTWQYQNEDGQWISYDEETNAKIDRAFNRNSNGKCIIEINNVIHIVKFTSMIQENQTDKAVVPVQRLEAKNEEEDDKNIDDCSRETIKIDVSD